jgi:asparaginyl-tRNA synthetase
MTLAKLVTEIRLLEAAESGPVCIAGWVRTRRDSKKFSFLEVNDGSSAHSVQVIADGTLENYASEILRLTTGASVWIEGQLVASPGKGQKFEVQAKSVRVMGYADPETFVLQKNDMSFEYLREVAHMRPRTATFASVFRLRSLVSQAIHRYFTENGYHWAHTPLITNNDGEGAGECFRVTALPLAELSKIPKTATGQTDFSKDFFGEATMLCVTGQLEAELMAMGMGKVYTFGPTFRAENSNTSRHLAEFWMIEPELAFGDLEDVMALAENLIRYVVKDVLQNGSADLEVVSKKAGVASRVYLEEALTAPFQKVTYTEAVEILLKSGQSFEFPVAWGEDLKSEHERYLCEKHFKAPTFVYNYPEKLKAFYMYLNEDGKTVRATDLLMPGIGEVIGGSQREDRLDVLESRIRDKGLDPTSMDWYLDLRRYGSVPHGGFGMGLERLLAWITGLGNVRDLIPFPRTPGNCKF